MIYICLLVLFLIFFWYIWKKENFKKYFYPYNKLPVYNSNHNYYEFWGHNALGINNQCEQKCLHLPYCKSYSQTYPNIQRPNGECKLFLTKMPMTRYNPRAFSGVQRKNGEFVKLLNREILL